MKDFKKGGFKSGGFNKKFNDRGGFGDRGGRGGDRGGDRGGHGFHDKHHGDDREMFKATCTECGKSCEVPFRPTGDKPVLCKECFSNKKEEQSGGFGNDRFNKRSFGNDRPSFGAPRFEKSFDAPRPDRRIDDLKAQVDHLTSKVDKVIALLQSTNQGSDKSKSFSAPTKSVAELAPTVAKAPAVIAKTSVKTEKISPKAKKELGSLIKKATAPAKSSAAKTAPAKKAVKKTAKKK